MHWVGFMRNRLKTGHGHNKSRSFTVHLSIERVEKVTTGKETRDSCEVSRRKLDMDKDSPVRLCHSCQKSG